MLQVDSDVVEGSDPAALELPGTLALFALGRVRHDADHAFRNARLVGSALAGQFDPAPAGLTGDAELDLDVGLVAVGVQ